MHDLKISLITVCYNSRNTIKRCIESVLTQSQNNIEYIIIDGGSTDGTLQIIEQYKKHINFLVSEPDKGIYDAMNKGIALATGDVIGILNSDDVYMNKHIISELMGLMQSQKAQVVFADLILVDQDNPNKVLRYYDSGHFHPNKFKYGWMPAHPTVFVKRALYDAVGPFATNYQIAADYEMLIRILAIQRARYAYLPKPVVRMRSGGASTAGLSRNWILNQEIIRACKENGIYSNMAMLLLKLPFKLWGKVAGSRWQSVQK